MRFYVSVALLLLCPLPALAETEPVCRATSADGSPVVTMRKPGGNKALAQVPSGQEVKTQQVKTVGDTGWQLIYPVSILSGSDGWVKASEVACDGKVATLWDYDATEYADEDPEFYCEWPLALGDAGTMINEFAFVNRRDHGTNPADDTYQVAGHPVPIRFWMDARADLNGETWLRAIYFDDENTVGWVRDADVVCQ